MKFFFTVFIFTLVCGAFTLDLECSFATKKLNLNDVNIQCDVHRNLVIASPEDVTITTVNGKVDSHSQLETLNIRRQIVHYFPKGLEKFFPNLKNISLKNSELKAITQNDLKPFTELKKLHLRFNEIEKLDGDLFKFNLKLEVIDFTGNKITTVGVNLLQPLTNLHKAFFRSNDCIDLAGLTPTGLQELKAELETRCAHKNFIE